MGAKTKQLVEALAGAEDRYRHACEEFEQEAKAAGARMKAALAAGTLTAVPHGRSDIGAVIPIDPKVKSAREKLHSAELSRRKAREALDEFLAKKASTNKTLHSLKQKIGKILPGKG